MQSVRAAPGRLRMPVKKPSNQSQMWAIIRRVSRKARSAVRRWFGSGNEEDVRQTTHLKWAKTDCAAGEGIARWLTGNTISVFPRARELGMHKEAGGITFKTSR